MRDIKFRYRIRRFTKKRIDEGYYYFTLHEIANGMLRPLNRWRYDILAIQQYTGLKDKNKIDIYEGDIVKADFSELEHIPIGKKPSWNTEVRFDLGAFFVTEPHKDCNGVMTVWSCHNHLEIIGNNFENPELLESDSNE